MVGLVVVSHSSRLAEGVVELAREMGGATVAIEAAGGVETGGALGTSATLIAAAIERAWSEDGVLVVMDLGSAVLSAEAALELLDEGHWKRVLLCDAPLAEGAVIAAVAAGSGASLEAVAAEARRALEPKTKHLDRGAPEPGSHDAAPEPAPSPSLTEPFCLNGIPAAPGIAYGEVCHAGPGGLSGAGILLVRDLTPDLAALLDPSQVFGVACAAGSPASYGAGLARSKGIPAVTGLGDAVLGVPEGMELLIDCEAGLLYGEASREIGAAYRFRASALEDSARRARSRVAEPGVTKDGERVEVLVMAPAPAGAEAEAAGATGADGIRSVLTDPEELAALLAARKGRPAEVLAAKAATVEEFRAVKEAAGAEEGVRLGAVVAVPAAALHAQALAASADFLSIDTDGLARHVMAAGPEGQADYLEPAVLTLIGRVVEAAEAPGTPVGVHGRAGGDPAALPLLVGLGVRQVTVLPQEVARVKESIRGLEAAGARSLATTALGLDSAEEVRRLAAGFLGADAGARRPQMGTRQMPETDGVAGEGSDDAGGTRR
ncbi:MAG: PTS-dependent dihydroxyacetone kinase phosphotransferase subunit DhaM [Actinobacteria bacterium]|nr:MAG: PTS-dependent dihydroxyacetone kinase phosphotransferase subunit DhaM [Actinomycetota bacterium]